jgi:hypothetical protein
MKFLNDKWLSMNKKVAYRKTLISLNKEDIRYVSDIYIKLCIND